MVVMVWSDGRWTVEIAPDLLWNCGRSNGSWPLSLDCPDGRFKSLVNLLIFKEEWERRWELGTVGSSLQIDGRNRSLIPSETADFNTRWELPVVGSPRWTVEIAPWLAVKECVRKKESERDDAFRASDAKCFAQVANTRDRVRDFPFFSLSVGEQIAKRFWYSSWGSKRARKLQMWLSSDFFWAFLVGMGEMGAQEECRMSLCRRE
jgi:hypothetical protein